MVRNFLFCAALGAFCALSCTTFASDAPFTGTPAEVTSAETPEPEDTAPENALTLPDGLNEDFDTPNAIALEDSGAVDIPVPTEPTMANSSATVIEAEQEDHPEDAVAERSRDEKQADASDAPRESEDAEARAAEKIVEENKTETVLDEKSLSPAAAPSRDAQIENKPTEVVVDNGPKGESVRVGLISWRDLPFQTVKHQAYDYSCGSAAVATLMTYVYNIPTTEKAVFEEMFVQADKAKVQKEGFSMLDMSRYLNNHGLEAQGYMISMRVIEKYQMPVIALVNNKGYNHFVVVKTTKGGTVLVGDPNTGNTEYSQEDFAHIWNGVAIVVTNEASRARTAFNNRNEWRFARAHVELRNGNDIGNETAELAPLSWQIAPTGPSILPAFMVGSPNSLSTGGGS